MKKAIWKSVLFLAIFALTIFLLVVPYMKFIDKQISVSASRLGQDIISILPAIFATWVMTKYFDKRKLVTAGLENKNILKDIIVGSVLALFWIGISFSGQYLFKTLERTSSVPAFKNDFMFYTLALLLNAASQEILFRGYLFQTINNNTGLKTAVVFTSFLFLLMHAGALQAGIIPSLNVFGAGLIFAVAFYRTGQLWLPISLHFVWNFMYSSILYKPIHGYGGFELFKTKGNNLLAGGENGVEATIITTITVVIIILAEHFFIPKKEEINNP